MEMTIFAAGQDEGVVVAETRVHFVLLILVTLVSDQMYVRRCEPVNKQQAHPIKGYKIVRAQQLTTWLVENTYGAI